MNGDNFPTFLREWRRANGVRQVDLAQLLGTSQGTISRWESGQDLPFISRARDICEFLANRRGRDTFALDVAFLRMQADCRALFDLDGAELLAVSKGLELLWPTFSELVGTRMRPHLVGESSAIYRERKLATGIRQGDVGIVTGVSHRHVGLSDDTPVKHQWILAFRRFGGRTVGEMVYQPCDPSRRLGIERVIRV